MQRCDMRGSLSRRFSGELEACGCLRRLCQGDGLFAYWAGYTIADYPIPGSYAFCVLMKNREVSVQTVPGPWCTVEPQVSHDRTTNKGQAWGKL